jgi:hypothetical protein
MHKISEAVRAKQILDVLYGFFADIILYFQAKRCIPQYRAPWQQMILLKHIPHGQIFVGIKNAFAGCRRGQSGDDGEEGRFPASARPHDRNKITFVNVKGKAFNRNRFFIGGMISFRDVLYFD